MSDPIKDLVAASKAADEDWMQRSGIPLIAAKDAEIARLQQELADALAERDEWSNAFIRTDKQLQAAESEAKLIRAETIEECARTAEKQGNIDWDDGDGGEYGHGYESACSDIATELRALDGEAQGNE
jgi:hypothetical protein